MPIQLHSLRAAIVFIAAIALSIGWGVWATVRHQEPRSLERSGAAIAAIAAIAVLFQIRTELKIEEERNALSRQAQEAQEVEDTSPIGALQSRLVRKRIELLQAGLVRARLRVAAFVVTGAMLGELLHGFGDLIACHLLISCPLGK